MRIGRSARASLYDAAIVPMTSSWYEAVLRDIEDGSEVLDVGIGTGAALLRNAALLTQKELRVTGIDIDRAYIERCSSAIAREGLQDRVEARLESVYEHAGGPYDAAYFSGSFMLLPDPPAALRHVATLLKPRARVYFTQTFEHERSRLAELVKPLLRYVTSIDFGSVTYEPDFEAALGAADFAVERRKVLHAARRRSSKLIVARPERPAIRPERG